MLKKNQKNHAFHAHVTQIWIWINEKKNWTTGKLELDEEKSYFWQALICVEQFYLYFFKPDNCNVA